MQGMMRGEQGRTSVGYESIGLGGREFERDIRALVSERRSEPERLREDLTQWPGITSLDAPSWDVVHREVLNVGGHELSRGVFQDERTQSFHRLGETIQAEAQASLKRLAPDFFEEFFGEDEELGEFDEKERESTSDFFMPMAMDVVEATAAVDVEDAVPMEVADLRLEVESAPLRSEESVEVIPEAESQHEDSQSTDLGTSQEKPKFYRRVLEDKVFAQSHLANTSDKVLTLLAECQNSQAAAFIEGSFLSDLIQLRTQIAQDTGRLSGFVDLATRENADQTIETIRATIVSHANTFESLQQRHELVLNNAQVERVELRRLRVLAQLKEECETYDWLRKSAQRQVQTLAGAMNFAWQSVIEHFTDRAPTPQAIEFHARQKQALAKRLRLDILQAGLPQTHTWEEVEKTVARVERTMRQNAFPPAMRRMLSGLLREFKSENHTLSTELEAGARFVGMAASESAKYLLSLALPGFIPLIHAGWDALEEASYQATLNGGSINPGEVYWKGIVGGLTGVLANETRSLSEAFADTALRSKVAQTISDDTVRAFTKVFASHAVDTVKDAFIVAPIEAVFLRDDAGDILENTDRLGALILQEIEKKTSVQEVAKTLLGVGLGG